MEVKKWLEENFEVDLEHLEITDFPKTGRGVRAKRKIEKGDLIIALPVAALLTSEQCCALVPELAELQSEFKFETCEILSIFLALYCKSSLPQYFASLPLEIDHVLNWSTSDLENLDFQIKSEYQKYKSNYIRHFKKVQKAIKIPESAFRSAWIRLNTRTVFLPQKIRTNDKSATWALAPFLDCLNHSAGAKVSVEVKEGFFTIRADYAIPEGSEVFISYGAHPDAFLLIEYGFVIGQSNHLNTVGFSIKDIFSDLEVGLKTKDYGCSDGFAISPGGISWSMLRSCLISAGNPAEENIYEEFSNWPKSIQNSTVQKVQEILNNKISDFSNRILKFENVTLIEFYTDQIRILNSFMKNLETYDFEEI